jgi:molybdopterin converting factor small subunit
VAAAGAGAAGVTVRYWAAARTAAGRAEDTVAAGSVADVLAAVRAVHQDSPRFGQVLDVSSLLLGDEPLGSRDPSDVRVAAGDVIEVLPPFAGG